MSKANNLKDFLTDIADSIRIKKGTTAPINPQDFLTEIITIPSVEIEAPYNDINFYDYDGFRVESWSLSELQSKTALPDNPTHSGLISQGWNWTLEQLKEENAPMNVGQMYITDNGKTRLYIRVLEGNLTIKIYLYTPKANIEWGDGDNTLIEAYNYGNAIEHTYSSAGNYIISIDSCNTRLQLGYSSYGIMGMGSDINFLNKISLTKVELGQNIDCQSTCAFESCEYLKTITLSNEQRSIYKNAFYYCTSLKYITLPPNNILNDSGFAYSNIEEVSLPPNLTRLERNMFKNCSFINNIRIPKSVTTLDTYALYYLKGMVKITIPENVNDIKSNCFASNFNMREYHFKSTTPPVLASTNVFSSIKPECKIYVPNESVEAYKTATNWTTYASQIYGE